MLSMARAPGSVETSVPGAKQLPPRHPMRSHVIPLAGAATLFALYQLYRDGVASRALVVGSLLFPLYYVGLSIVLSARRVSR